MREPKYPIFTVDREGWMSMVDGPEEVVVVYEEAMIEEGEFSGWDVDGYPITLLWDANTGSSVKVCQEIAQPAELHAAILHYAKLGSPDSQFTQPPSVFGVVELFEAVERHIEETRPRLTRRIKRLFGR